MTSTFCWLATMFIRQVRTLFLIAAVAASISGCGGGSDSPPPAAPPPAGPAVASITLAPALSEQFWGYDLIVTATARDANGAVITPLPTLQWASSDTSIATVSATGTASLLRPGDLTVTASVGGVQATTAIKVVGFERLSRGRGDTVCALRDGRRAIYCWGNGSSGDFPVISGTPRSFDYAEPVRIAQGDIPAGALISKVVLGLFRACALTDAGSVHCWGDNTRGRLGVGTGILGRAAPTAIALGAAPAGTSYVDVALGSHTGCAIAATGAIYCWGDNGLIPNPALSVTGFSSEPVATVPGNIPNTVKPVRIEVDLNRACVLGDDGRAYCWQTGGDFPVLIAQGDVPSGAKLVRVQVGSDMPCALADNGQVFCWGSTSGARFGAGSAAFTTTASPLAVSSGVKPANVKFTSITVGGIAISNCAAAEDGKGYCWGTGYRGSLADGNAANHDALTPALVMDGDKPPTVGWIDIHCAQYVCTGLATDRRIYSWGSNQSLALGLPNSSLAATLPRLISRPVSP